MPATGSLITCRPPAPPRPADPRVSSSKRPDTRQPRTRAHTEDAVFRFYLPMARTLARSSARYPHDPEGAEQAAELGLAQAVLAWRHPTGQGFDRAARAAIINHLQQGRARTAPHLRRQDDRPARQWTGAHHPIDE